MCKNSLHVALAYLDHFRNEKLPFHDANFDTSLQILLVIDELGRIAAQPRNGAPLKISVCPDKMITFS